jgi:hypothetical protein
LVTIFHPWESELDDSPVWYDALFSIILYVANKYMIKIADIIGDDTQEIKERISRTEANSKSVDLLSNSATEEKWKTRKIRVNPKRPGKTNSITMEKRFLL